MAFYTCDMQRTADTTDAVGSVQAPGASMRRIKIVQFIVGSEANAADNEFLWSFQRSTTAGTSTAVTPIPLDPADAAAVSVAGENFTANPTLTAGQFVLQIPLNQRNTAIWSAYPGAEIVIPATVNNGVTILTPTASAVVVTAQAVFEEQ